LRVYHLEVLEGYEWVLPTRKADYETLSFDGTPRASTWKPVTVKLLRAAEDGTKFSQSDMPWLGTHAPVLRTRAVAALKEFLSVYGELLPLACADGDLQVFNATSIVAALDAYRSEVVTFSSGGVMTIKEYAFKPSTLRGVGVFKLPEIPRGPVFFTEEFVMLVQRRGLIGVGFKLVWDSSRRRLPDPSGDRVRLHASSARERRPSRCYEANRRRCDDRRGGSRRAEVDRQTRRKRLRHRAASRSRGSGTS